MAKVGEKNWELKVEIVKTSKKKQVSTSMFNGFRRKNVQIKIAQKDFFPLGGLSCVCV